MKYEIDNRKDTRHGSQEKESSVKYKVCKGHGTVPGIRRDGAVTSFSVENKTGTETVLVLYPTDDGKPERIPMERDPNRGFLYTVGLKGFEPEAYDYVYEFGGIPHLDPFARRIVGRKTWGDEGRVEASLRCAFPKAVSFAWGEDRLPQTAKQDMVMYKLHVRGFSMLDRLPEAERGTFRAIERRLNYFKELGVTTLELMPVYEFEEMFAQDPYQHEFFPKSKINYWGYTTGNYFAPKAAYLGAENDERSFKQLVKSMHRKGLECVLEFYFSRECNPHYAVAALRFWAEEYHVDGFHVICSEALAGWIARDYHLSGRKLFFDWFSEEDCLPTRREMELFSYNDAFLYAVRKAMNDHGGSMQEFADNLRRQQKHQGFVNYLATNNGFCLNDLFTYTERRNLDNGEENRDGVSQNFSDNCGEEGESSSTRVNRRRIKQIKNAMCALMFAQGVPLIWMGDEHGNTQSGNNNPYCQDNAVGWKSWENKKKNRELMGFFKELSAIRRRYPALRNPLPMELYDYKGCGYPDLSYHGLGGWRIQVDGQEKIIGMLYACVYAGERNSSGQKDSVPDEYLYVGYNFSVANQELALPALPKGYHWHCVLNTGTAGADPGHMLVENVRSFLMERQSVCLLAGRQEQSAEKRSGSGRREQSAEKRI